MSRPRIRGVGSATTRTRRPWPSSTCWPPTAGRAADLRAAAAPDLGAARPAPDSADRWPTPERAGCGGSATAQNLIDTVYVENAAAAHLLAADALRPGSPVAGRAYFISQGEPVNCWAWIDEILALAGLPPVRKSHLAAGGVGWSAPRTRRSTGCCGLRGEPPMTPVPGGPVGHLALLQHRPGPPRFRLPTDGFDGRRDAPAGGGEAVGRDSLRR